MSIEINNESTESVDEVRVLALATFALDYMHLHPDTDLAIVFVDEPAMEVLHIQWMDEPGPTDVLSFPMDELRPGSEGQLTPAGLLGDIVVCPQVAATQAKQALLLDKRHRLGHGGVVCRLKVGQVREGLGAGGGFPGMPRGLTLPSGLSGLMKKK